MAPAGPAREGELERGAAVLATRYVVRHGPDIESRHGYLAGDDARRARELADALADPEARAIIALRGGYGTMRILPQVADALPALRAAPKALVGSSDLTALGCAMLSEGLGWIHGPMVRTLGRTDAGSIERLFRVLEGVDDEVVGDLRGVAPGTARGLLAGGNLSVLTALAGTRFFPDLAGTIVLLEDVSEKPYRIDRLATQLLLSGAFARVAGFVLGDLTDCAGAEGDPSPEDVLVERLRPLGVPIVAGFPAAHGPRCWALRMGEVMEIDAKAGTLRRA